MGIVIEKICGANIVEARSYLSSHEETTQFLLNNLREHGPELTSHSNSGNFKLVLDEAI